jgi:hypothetical protein
MSARTFIIVPQFPMSEPTTPRKPRAASQGKSDSRYLARLLPATLEDVYNPATSPSSSSQFFTLPSSSPHFSIPHFTLIHINPLDYSLFSHYPEFRALLSLSPVLNSSLFASQSVPSVTLEHDPFPTLTPQPSTVPH